MVNHLSDHHAERDQIRMIPLQLGTWMIANWRFKQDQTRPELIRQSQTQTDAPKRSIDPFAVREEFWRVKNEGEMLDLLNRTGIRWENDGAPSLADGIDGALSLTDGSEGAFFLADVFTFREFTKQAVVKPTTEWQRIGKDTVPKGKIAGGSVWYVDAIESLKGMLCQPSEDGICFQATYADFKQAILAAVLTDKLEHNRYKICRKPGCGMPFKIDVRKTKKFCTEAHQQAEMMRKFRRKKLRKAKKS